MGDIQGRQTGNAKWRALPYFGRNILALNLSVAARIIDSRMLYDVSESRVSSEVLSIHIFSGVPSFTPALRFGPWINSVTKCIYKSISKHLEYSEISLFKLLLRTKAEHVSLLQITDNVQHYDVVTNLFLLFPALKYRQSYLMTVTV